MMALIAAQIFMLGLGLWAARLTRGTAARPQPPGFWLIVIAASIIPTLAAGLTFLRPETGHFIITALPGPIQTAVTPSAALDIPITVNWHWAQIYLCVAALIFARHLFHLARLHRLRAAPQADHADLYLSDAALPPLALGWPKQRIIVSKALWSQLVASDRSMLLAHERCHLDRRDPDVTLVLLALQSLFWINPAFRRLVTGWREAIERRADAAVLETHNRRAYAKLFTRLARTAANLPVPTQSKPRNTGDFIMRLNSILKPQAHFASKRSLAAILGLSLTASLGVSIAGATSPNAEPQPLKRVPPMMPNVCPDLPRDTLLSSEATPTALGWVEAGVANLRFDVNADGKPVNIEVTSANAACFQDPSIHSVEQWVYPPNAPADGVDVQITFRLSVDRGATVEEAVSDFFGAEM